MKTVLVLPKPPRVALLPSLARVNAALWSLHEAGSAAFGCWALPVLCDLTLHAPFYLPYPGFQFPFPRGNPIPAGCRNLADGIWSWEMAWNPVGGSAGGDVGVGARQVEVGAVCCGL